MLRPLSKKRSFRTHFDSQHVRESQALANSPSERFYHVVSSLSGKLISGMSPLVLGEILGMFVTKLTADEKYFVQDCQNLQLPIQMQLSEKKKLFLNFFFHFWNLHQVINILKQKMIVIANVFPK